MKKFLAVIFAAVLAVVSLAGCSGNDPEYVSAKDGEWIEVQSIVYYLNDDTSYSSSQTSYTSWKYRKYYFVRTKLNSTSITKEEYDNAPESQKETPYPTNHVTSLSSLKNLSSSIGKTFYRENYSYDRSYYEKVILENYEIFPLKVRFAQDGSIYISSFAETNNHKPSTIRIKPLSYEITYFND